MNNKELLQELAAAVDNAEIAAGDMFPSIGKKLLDEIHSQLQMLAEVFPYMIWKAQKEQSEREAFLNKALKA